MVQVRIFAGFDRKVENEINDFLKTLEGQDILELSIKPVQAEYVNVDVSFVCILIQYQLA